MDKIYGVFHIYDEDGGFGDAIRQERLICVFEKQGENKMNITCREFLEKKQKQKKYQNCLVRVFDFDEYEHMNFRLREDTDFDNFNNVYDQELLDSCVSEYFIWNDENGITIDLYGDIEL